LSDPKQMDARKKIKVLELEDITLGYPGLTPSLGSSMLEACVVTFFKSGHKTGVKLLVKGAGDEQFTIRWNLKYGDQLRRTWNDQDEATEFAATCISILLAFRKTGYSVIERSFKKTGVDYWLGSKVDELNIFENKARLEVSGIFKGNERKVEYRTKIKLHQSKQSDSSKLPAFISVVEFSQPQSKFVRRQ
jgi:hypothetical protein